MKKSTMKWLVAAVCMLLVVAAVVPSFAGTLGSATVVGGRDGKDGKDGVDGKDGKDGLTPIFRVNSQTNEWEYSYTGGLSWLSMGVKAGDKYDAFNKLNPEYIDQAWYANFGQKGGGDSIVISNQTLTSGIWSKLQMDIQPGITYDVFINDIVYSCICYEHSDGGYFLGKGSLSGDTHGIESDAPFCIFWPGSYATSGMFFTDSSLSYPLTLKVTDAFVDTYNKLPIEYLPDELLTVADVEELIKNAGSGIDVVAKPGETIIVKEVDANGKPTKWESAEYQPRTHWSEEKVILPETVVECSELDEDEDGVGDGLFFGMLPEFMMFTPGNEYKVTYNGVDYLCKTIHPKTDSDEIWILGNSSLAGFDGGVVDAPFVLLMHRNDTGEGIEASGMIVNIDGSTTVTLSIAETGYHTIPREYLPKQQYIFEVPMESFRYNDVREDYTLFLSEIPLELLEAMYLQMPIYLKVTEVKGGYNTKDYIAPAQYGGLIDVAWSVVDKTLEMIPVSGNVSLLDIRLSAYIANTINGFSPFYIQFLPSEDEEVTE